MLQRLIGNRVLTTPYFRFTTSGGVALDPVFTAVGATFEWISPDGSISTGTTPNPVLDQTGNYAVKCSDWDAVTAIAFNIDTVTAMENLHLFTSLDILRCFTNDISVLDITSLPISLRILSCHTNPNLEILDISGKTTLQQILCNDCSISTLDTSELASLTKLRCEDNSITSLDLALCTVLTDIRCNNNGMSEAAVDNILADLVTAGANNGTILMHGTNATPSAAGLANKAILQAAPRNWTVTTS